MIKRIRSGVSFSVQMQVRLAWLLLFIVMAVFTIWVGDLVLLRYDTFKATAFDLGNMDQAAWNTLHGHPFEFTNHADNWYSPPIRLAQHTEPIFFLLALLYFVHSDPRTLLLFQLFAMVAGAIPVFFMARKALPTLPLAAPLFVMGYFATPAMLGQTLYDFHAVALVSPLLLFAMWALLYRRYVWFFICCVLAMACKEEIGAVVALFALVAIWKFRIPRLGALIFVIGITWTALCFLVIEPHFNVGAQQNNFWYRYAALGPSPAAAIGNILLHPWILFGVLITLDRVYYIAGLLRSTGFLALLAPEWLIPALPTLAINLLTSQSFQHNGVYQYHAAIIPFVVIASIMGARRLYLYWYGVRGEKEEQQLYYEDEFLGTNRYAAGKPLPGSGPVIALVVRVALSIWHWLGRLWRFLVTRLHLQAMRDGVRGHLKAMRERTRNVAAWLPVSWLQSILAVWLCCMMALNVVIAMPLLSYILPTHLPGAREQHIEQLLSMIPANAVVSAGGDINPHLTERRYVTVFPELTVATLTRGQDIPVDYVIVDLDDVSPENQAYSDNYVDVLNQIQRTGQFRTIAQADGVILLERVKI